MSPSCQRLREHFGSGLLLIPGVAAIVHNEEGHLLLVETHHGSWSLPAGAIEPGESPEDAMHRELQEETGLTCEEATLRACLGGREFRHTYPNGHQVEYTVVLFHCTVSGQPNIIDRAEVHSLRFFSRHEFPGLALPYDLDLLYEER